MADRDPHRDALEAAHARIAQLERDLAANRGQSAEANALAALLRERTAAQARLTPPSVWSALRWLFVVFPVAALGFAADRDWVLAALALAAPFAMGLVGQQLAKGSAHAAARQIALIDERVEEIRRRAAPRA